MIGPADIEAWSDDAAEHAAAQETTSESTTARVLPFPNFRTLSGLQVKRSCEKLLAWQRHVMGRRF